MTTTTAPARIAGPFAVRDASGAHLCGPNGLHKGSNGNIRRDMRDRWESALRLADLMRGECVWNRKGELVRCECEVYTTTVGDDGSVSLAWLPRGHGSPARDGFVDFGHIIANDTFGVYCGCNAVPVEGRTNREDRDARPVIHPAWPMAHYRAAWREVSLSRMTRTKASRAV